MTKEEFHEEIKKFLPMLDRYDEEILYQGGWHFGQPLTKLKVAYLLGKCRYNVRLINVKRYLEYLDKEEENYD